MPTYRGPIQIWQGAIRRAGARVPSQLYPRPFPLPRIRAGTSQQPVARRAVPAAMRGVAQQWRGQAAAAAAPAPTTPPTPAPVPKPVVYGGTPVPGRGAPLSWNPQLLFPDMALASAGAIDAQYTSSKNTALTNFYKQYHDTLRNLGYMDEQGHYQEGELALQDRRQRALYQMDLADEERATTEQSRDLGNLFSGARVRALSDAQRETVQQLSDLDIETPRAQAQGYEDILGVGGAYDVFNQAMQQAIAEAIARHGGTYDYGYTAPQ